MPVLPESSGFFAREEIFFMSHPLHINILYYFITPLKKGRNRTAICVYKKRCKLCAFNRHSDWSCRESCRPAVRESEIVAFCHIPIAARRKSSAFDMASGYQGRDLRGGFGFGGVGSAVQMLYQQRSEGGAFAGAGGLLKRSVTEMERQRQMQQSIFLRSVKPKKAHLASPLPLISPFPAANLSGSSTTTASSSILSSPSVPSAPLLAPGIPNSSSTWSFQAGIPAVEADSVKKSTMTNRLLELERHLLDDNEEEVSICGSEVSNSEWSETMQKLMSPPPPPPPQPPMAAVTNQSPHSPSTTTSSSSSSCSPSSCSPSSATPSRQMLLETATAISDGNQEAAAANLAVLKRAANLCGTPEQRLTAMMVAALASRINPPAPGSSFPASDVCNAEHLAAVYMLYEASPCFKLGLMAANLAILDATKDQPKIHIVDFDVGQGGQLASLIRAIADNHRNRSIACQPPSVKITAVCDLPVTGAAISNLALVGDRLAKLAERLGVGLRFSIVNRRTQELDQTSLGCEPGEALAVNFVFFLSRVADESVSPENPRDELLRRVKALRPRIVTLVEQEMNGNTAPFATRFAEACAHYGALLESMDATAGRENADRARLEACLARKAINSIIREGADRIERCEVYGKWRARMGMAGFQPVHLGPAVSEPVKFRLGSLRNNPGFTLKEEAAWLGCGWMGRVLTVASAWR